MNLTLYCNSFNGKEPLHRQYDQKTLMCGSYFLKDEVKTSCLEKGHILDNTGINISTLNPILGDLTGLYWVWKNTDHEFVGTNQYRRFYNQTQLDSFFPLTKNKLFVSNFLVCENSVWQHYVSCHGQIGLQILNEAVRLKTIPLTKSMIDVLNHTSLISPCNMFFGHRKIFDDICKILFEIIFELYQGTKYTLNFIQTNIHSGRNSNERRLLAFLAERILNVIYFNSKYFLGDTDIQPIEYRTIL